MGDSSVLPNLPGKVVVAFLLGEGMRTEPRPTDPPPNWKGTKASWARSRINFEKGREKGVKEAIEKVRSFHMTQAKYKDRPNVTFLGLLLGDSDAATATKVADQYKFTLPIVRTESSRQLPSVMVEEIVIYDVAGKAVYSGPLNSKAEGVLRKAVSP